MIWLRYYRGGRPKAQPNPTYSHSPPSWRSIPLKHFHVSVGGRSSATLWHGPLMLMAGNEWSLCICHGTNGASSVLVWTCVCFCISMISSFLTNLLNATFTTSLACIIARLGPDHVKWRLPVSPARSKRHWEKWKLDNSLVYSLLCHGWPSAGNQSTESKEHGFLLT